MTSPWNWGMLTITFLLQTLLPSLQWSAGLHHLIVLIFPSLVFLTYAIISHIWLVHNFCSLVTSLSPFSADITLVLLTNHLLHCSGLLPGFPDSSPLHPTVPHLHINLLNPLLEGTAVLLFWYNWAHSLTFRWSWFDSCLCCSQDLGYSLSLVSPQSYPSLRISPLD